MSSKGKSFGKFIILWLGEFISSIGSGITSFGLGVYVFNRTGKVTAIAFVTLLAFMPSILLATVAGVLADRYDRRLLMVLGDSLSAVGLVFILICMLKNEAQIWQIYVGITISSVFSSLLAPSYKATVTDLLTKEQYTKASGLVQLAASAKYLISPAIAGLLLKVYDIKLLLVIDICTFIFTVTSTLVVRRGLVSRISEQKKSFICDLKDGWGAITKNKGVLLLVVITSVITFFIGIIQTLFTPMILAFSDSSTLGMVETIAASGMLVTSIIIGILHIKRGYVKILSFSLYFAGVFMTVLGLRENIVLICISGFLFFAMLPFANTSIDFLIRTNIQNDLQGRAWGLIGIISQLGYLIAYGITGVLSDYVFTPLLIEGGALAGTVGKVIGTGTGRGIAFLIIISGVLICITSLILYKLQSIKNLESRGDLCILE